MGRNVVFDSYNLQQSLDWALPLVTACVQQYPAIVAHELGKVSTDGQDHPLRTPSAGARRMTEAGRHPGIDADGAAETEGDHWRFRWQDQCSVKCRGVFSVGLFRSNSNGPLDGLTTEETVEFKALEALPPFDENGDTPGRSKASRPPAAKNAGSNYT
jgi:hypothetical protein